MKKAGIIILIVGLVLTLSTGMSFVTKKKVVSPGKVEITANRSHSFSRSPLVGILVMAAGVGLYIAGKNQQAVEH